MSFPIRVNDQISLSPTGEQDIPAYLRELNDKDFYDRSLLIPFPYTDADAKWFINHCNEMRERFGHEIHLAIRDEKENLIGGAGFHGKNTHPVIAHVDHIGYWVAKPHWNKGIMSQVVPKLIEYGRHVRGISRFEAAVYEFNKASARVLIKNGFSLEAKMKNAYYKNGQYHNAELYTLVID
jgi:[ribosomal protein S5]-alanine N-acetyltransferase